MEMGYIRYGWGEKSNESIYQKFSMGITALWILKWLNGKHSALRCFGKVMRIN